jgi:hypothetical protein
VIRGENDLAAAAGDVEHGVEHFFFGRFLPADAMKVVDQK